MSSNPPGPRPQQVTIGGWVIAVASAMLVARVYDGMAGLESVDTRDQLTQALTTGAWKGLDLSVADAVSVMRVGLYVAGLAAVVTGILGIFVLQRHATARVVLTVAAVPVVVTAPLAGGFLGLIVGGATVLLWSQPARDWFAGRPPRRARVEPPAPAAPVAPVPPAVPAARAQSPRAVDGRPADQSPAPTPGWGAPTTVPPAYPPAYPPVSGTPAAQTAAPGPWTPPRRREPTPVQVRVACILTWVLAGLTAGLYTLVVAAIAIDRSAVLDLVHDNPSVRDAGLTDNALVAIVVAVSAVLVLWCLGAGLLAVLAWRRQTWAWILLLVSAGASVLAGLLVLPFSVAHVVGAATAFGLLLRAPVRAWFAGAERPAPPLNPPPDASPGPPAPSAPIPPAPRQDGKPPVW
jgi:hypothetical protein